jgi:hypothetical protein
MTAVKDIDAFSRLDPTTGLPIYDGQCPARRWLEALYYGPTFPEQHKNNQGIPAGRCREQQTPSGTDRRSQDTDRNKLHEKENKQNQ